MTKKLVIYVSFASLSACSSGQPLQLGNTNSQDAAPNSHGGCDKCRVFVTSGLYKGDFGGLEAADSHCSAAAQKAGLGGAWTAWLSDSKAAAVDRIHGDGPWYLTDRKTLAFPNRDALGVNPRAGIDQDESGNTYDPAYVWTGTNPFHPPTSCADWKTTSGTGTSVYAGAIYLNITDDPCSQLRSLICFEQ
jgi:hypothetical protein